MRRPRTFLLSAVIATALSLTACGKDANPHTAGVLGNGAQYVAIGDSYTAAPRTGPPAADDGCLQTTVNYPRLVAARLDFKLTDVSCGGATTQNVTQPQPLGANTAPPQLDGLSSATDLVTVSLGANDFNTFGSVVFYCMSIRATDPAGAPCTEVVSRATGKNSLEGRIAQIEEHLVAVIRLVKKRAPDARVIFVGYPQFFPTAGPCKQFPLAADDYPLARRVNVLLVDAQKNAAKKSKVDYVDVFSATQGHDMCAADPWIAGSVPTRSDAAPFHPYPEEQRVVADLVVKLLG